MNKSRYVTLLAWLGAIIGVVAFYFTQHYGRENYKLQADTNTADSMATMLENTPQPYVSWESSNDYVSGLIYLIARKRPIYEIKIDNRSAKCFSFQSDIYLKGSELNVDDTIEIKYKRGKPSSDVADQEGKVAFKIYYKDESAQEYELDVYKFDSSDDFYVSYYHNIFVKDEEKPAPQSQ